MAELVIRDLAVRVGSSQILTGVDLTVRSGEVHAVMGPNGSGKSTLSHVLMGRPGYEVTGGTVHLDGVDILAMPTWQRAAAGLFLAMQYPVEVPGVRLLPVLQEAAAAAGRDPEAVSERIETEADRLGFDTRLLDRSLNVDLSGGEQKRNEMLQLAVSEATIAILDELDSGLDVDGLRTVADRIEAATEERDLGVLVITHYSRLLEVLRPDRVHVLARGAIQTSGGPELAEALERTGYGEWVDETDSTGDASPSTDIDPFADPLV